MSEEKMREDFHKWMDSQSGIATYFDAFKAGHQSFANKMPVEAIEYGIGALEEWLSRVENKISIAELSKDVAELKAFLSTVKEARK